MLSGVMYYSNLLQAGATAARFERIIMSMFPLHDGVICLEIEKRRGRIYGFARVSEFVALSIF